MQSLVKLSLAWILVASLAVMYFLFYHDFDKEKRKKALEKRLRVIKVQMQKRLSTRESYQRFPEMGFGFFIRTVRGLSETPQVELAPWRMESVEGIIVEEKRYVVHFRSIDRRNLVHYVYTIEKERPILSVKQIDMQKAKDSLSGEDKWRVKIVFVRRRLLEGEESTGGNTLEEALQKLNETIILLRERALEEKWNEQELEWEWQREKLLLEEELDQHKFMEVNNALQICSLLFKKISLIRYGHYFTIERFTLNQKESILEGRAENDSTLDFLISSLRKISWVDSRTRILLNESTRNNGELRRRYKLQVGFEKDALMQYLPAKKLSFSFYSPIWQTKILPKRRRLPPPPVHSNLEKVIRRHVRIKNILSDDFAIITVGNVDLLIEPQRPANKKQPRRWQLKLQGHPSTIIVVKIMSGKGIQFRDSSGKEVWLKKTTGKRKDIVSGAKSPFLPPVNKRSRQIGPNRWQISSQDHKYFVKNYDLYISDLAPATNYDHNRKPIGFRIRRLSKAAQYGFQKGDIVTTVNGDRLRRVEQIRSLIKKNLNKKRVEIVLLRNGRKVSLFFHFKNEIKH